MKLKLIEGFEPSRWKAINVDTEHILPSGEKYSVDIIYFDGNKEIYDPFNPEQKPASIAFQDFSLKTWEEFSEEDGLTEEFVKQFADELYEVHDEAMKTLIAKEKSFERIINHLNKYKLNDIIFFMDPESNDYDLGFEIKDFNYTFSTTETSDNDTSVVTVRSNSCDLEWDVYIDLTDFENVLTSSTEFEGIHPVIEELEDKLLDSREELIEEILKDDLFEKLYEPKYVEEVRLHFSKSYWKRFEDFVEVVNTEQLWEAIIAQKLTFKEIKVLWEILSMSEDTDEVMSCPGDGSYEVQILEDGEVCHLYIDFENLREVKRSDQVLLDDTEINWTLSLKEFGDLNAAANSGNWCYTSKEELDTLRNLEVYNNGGEYFHGLVLESEVKEKSGKETYKDTDIEGGIDE